MSLHWKYEASGEQTVGRRRQEKEAIQSASRRKLQHDCRLDEPTCGGFGGNCTSATAGWNITGGPTDAAGCIGKAGTAVCWTPAAPKKVGTGRLAGCAGKLGGGGSCAAAAGSTSWHAEHEHITTARTLGALTGDQLPHHKNHEMKLRVCNGGLLQRRNFCSGWQLAVHTRLHPQRCQPKAAVRTQSGVSIKADHYLTRISQAKSQPQPCELRHSPLAQRRAHWAAAARSRAPTGTAAAWGRAPAAA